jgi:hypothetical protein
MLVVCAFHGCERSLVICKHSKTTAQQQQQQQQQ